MTISIIVPVFNGLGHNLERCLHSITEQHLPDGDYEVICVDDCSDDGVTAQWLNEQKGIKIVRTPRNVRQGGARNLGVEHASGRYFTFIDQDDYYLPGALRIVYDTLHSFSGDLLVLDNREVWADGSQKPIEKKLGFENTNLLSPMVFIENNGVVYAPWRMVINRTRYLSAGIRFRQDTRLEDIDWGIRLLAAVNTMQYLPLPLVCWHHNPINTTGSFISDSSNLNAYLEACTIAMADARSLFPGNQKVERFVARSIDYGIQYMFLLPDSSKFKTQSLRALPTSTQYRPLIRYILKHPLTSARIINLGRPLWRIAHRLYRQRHR